MRPRVFSAVVLTVCLGHSLGQNSAEIGTWNSPRTYIPDSLVVPGFTPPAPAARKAMPAMRVDAAVTVPTRSSRTLTLIRGEASTLPDLPPPPVPTISGRQPLTAGQTARNLHHRRHTLQFGATVYDHRVSHIQWRHPDTGETYDAVCGFDIGLLAGTAPVTLIQNLIAAEKDRLALYQADRLRHQQAAAWEKANPVPPRDETYWFRPHRGSRYLTDPKPETARE